jgi:hypothetical protein
MFKNPIRGMILDEKISKHLSQIEEGKVCIYAPMPARGSLMLEVIS